MNVENTLSSIENTYIMVWDPAIALQIVIQLALKLSYGAGLWRSYMKSYGEVSVCSSKCPTERHPLAQDYESGKDIILYVEICKSRWSLVCVPANALQVCSQDQGIHRTFYWAISSNKTSYYTKNK